MGKVTGLHFQGGIADFDYDTEFAWEYGTAPKYPLFGAYFKDVVLKMFNCDIDLCTDRWYFPIIFIVTRNTQHFNYVTNFDNANINWH